MECLYKIDLRGTGIEELPESIENIKMLKHLSSKDCKRLKSLPQSIGTLKHLKKLIVHDCPNLQGKFPEIRDVMECLYAIDLRGTGIEELPESIENIKMLKHIRKLSRNRGCYGMLGKFPEIRDVMECLYEIDLRGTGIEELPESIENIKMLKHLSLKDCKRLRSLPQSIGPLKHLEKLIVHDCPNLQGKFPEIRDVMECLYEIDLRGTGIEELPESIENIKMLKHLKLPRLPLGLTTLDINYCERLKSIQQLPSSLLVFEATGCASMKTISSCESAHTHNRPYFGLFRPMFWRFENCLDLDHNTCNHIIADTVYNGFYGACPFVDIVYPGDEIPKWFENASTSDGNSINFQLPLNWFKLENCQVPFVVCIVGVLNNFDDDKRRRIVSLKYNINFKTYTSDGRLHKYIDDGHAESFLQANTRKADHVFIMHNGDMRLDGRKVLGQLIQPHLCFNRRNVDTLQASFSICLMEGAGVDLDIKKCGIHFYDYGGPNVDSTSGECSDQASGYQNTYIYDRSVTSSD
ncbi:hypothetical protein FEM48_Zijuj11G0164000 [Ziziphus jujuba var. spinosa]|uniref:C-JID domain-containing protein n=1 Tax=Ziziphus jujuba var. spinosa TaxID=714518 RepID=A0A978UK06_ZIZJJ|nr:hypothetical protein FEM48_Zijuj11G0164000 [Ziziphus jujuba var. spinosa]